MKFKFIFKHVNEGDVTELYSENDSCGTENTYCDNSLCYNNIDCS